MSTHSIDPGLYRERDLVRVRRALVAVSDKRGLVELATALAGAGVEIVSTGGTAAAIAAAGLPVTQVPEVTGYPEHLDGRVRTLHPGVHSGLLADLRLEDHERQLAELGIKPFELVVVNLYPFAEAVAAGAAPDAAIEQIDIGGPAMVRASAKNHANVAVVVSPDRYDEIVAAVEAGGTTLAQRASLAREAFRHTASYDVAVASYIGSVIAPDQPADESPFPAWVGGTWTKDADLRYGENSHQKAAIYSSMGGRPGIAQAVQLHGKEMSYNNYVDADAAVRAAFDFDEPAVAIIKHANPCGIAIASPGASDPIADAHRRAHECDPVSAFGGVIAANRTGDPRDGRDRRRGSSPRCSSRPRSRPRPSSCSRRRRTSACSRCPRASPPPRSSCDRCRAARCCSRPTGTSRRRPSGRSRPATPSTRRPSPTSSSRGPRAAP